MRIHLGAVVAAAQAIALVAGAPLPVAAQAAQPVASTPADLVRAAVVARMGRNVEVSVELAGMPADAPVVRRVVLDPLARTGRPSIARFYSDSSRALAVTATIHVVAEHVVLRRAVERGQTLGADDFDSPRGEVVDVPLRPLPIGTQAGGARVLRPMPAGATVLDGFLVVRRAIEPGDQVTAVLASGAIEISARLVAADGGRVGDVIRIVNPETKRLLKGRIVNDRTVEVIYGR
jgi:flagella basal body P-ring formation protein FlgA